MTTRSADGFGSVTTPAYRCVWLTGGASHGRKLVTDGAGHDIPAQTGPRLSFHERRHTSAYLQRKRTCPQIRARHRRCPCLGARRQRKRTRAAPSDRSPSRWQRAWSPLSTGCPGPFQAQPPVQPVNTALAHVSATPCREGGWMLAPSGMTSPEPDEPAGPASEPWCWTEQQLTADPGNVNRGVPVRAGPGRPLLAGHGSLAPSPLSWFLVGSICPEGLYLWPGEGENKQLRPSCAPRFRGMDHPT
jgi:hypothetical protein